MFSRCSAGHDKNERRNHDKLVSIVYHVDRLNPRRPGYLSHMDIVMNDTQRNG